MSTTPLPLFDKAELLKEHTHPFAHDYQKNDFEHSREFLTSYAASLGTYNSYRREVERLLHWSWQYQQGSVNTLTREDIQAFVEFCQSPPKGWLAEKSCPRFIEKEGKRIANTAWRPFLIRQTKSEKKRGITKSKDDYQLSNGAVNSVFSILSTYFNFLLSINYATANPVALIRQKSRFIRKQQTAKPIRRLSTTQWQYLLETVQLMAAESPSEHERSLFMLSLLYGMYLRISELAASPRWTPQMNDFFKDSDGNWWFTTVSKGNKQRQIAVSNAVLGSLKRWREHLNLTPLPSAADNTPLLPKLRGKGPMSDPAPLRRIIQQCFDFAEERLLKAGLADEALNLTSATVHWLRHTGISDDIKHRPREHVRDDAGHSSSATTDRYIDVELKERHKSAKHKSLNEPPDL